MTACTTFNSKSFFSCSNGSAATSSARIHNLVDTAANLVVSLCVVRLLDVRVILREF